MNPSSTPLSGVLPVFQTPFHEDESIDFDTLDRELAWLADQGADGVVMAMVSEVLRLSGPEREHMARHVCTAHAGRGAVIISVGAESSHRRSFRATGRGKRRHRPDGDPTGGHATGRGSGAGVL